ncbi:hypothetical protein [Macrococcus brunensis]|uniref:hypothetical protein n=1 Tax=Macrococcus brunensis TaxID=198483 RepID=UPI001EF08437|nr:hypothetical protein [Macrococcus brunensis]ULG73024.1 hypothetical protein MGG12_05775 [Macrococcus brunensis]
MFKPTKVTSFKSTPEFLRDGKNVEYTVGNPILDGSKFSAETVVKQGTAIFRNTSTNKFELVASDTPATMVGAVLTANDVKVPAGVDYMVPAVRKASVIKERTTGVTDNFITATKGRIVFDV